jgi:pyrroline-5-carboxylate reductase
MSDAHPHPARRSFSNACRPPLTAGQQARLLAVSKTPRPKPSRASRCPGRQAGQRAFGENYVQEALAKQPALGGLALEWHLIGHLQSNKAAKPPRLRLGADRGPAQAGRSRWPAHRPAGKPPLNVLIQVNIDDETSKHGCRRKRSTRWPPPSPPSRARPARADGDPRAAPRHGAPPRRVPAHARAVRGPRRPASGVDTLSMGMSEDFALAIAEGATMVRIGSALFAARVREDRPRPGDAWRLQHQHFCVTDFRIHHRLHRRRQHGPQPDRRPARARPPLPHDPRRRTGADALREALAAISASPCRQRRGRRRRRPLWVLAVKPQVMRAVCEALATLAQAKRRWWSPSPPASLRATERWLGGGVAVVRAMPNTPALLGAGVTGLFASPEVDANGRERAEQPAAGAGKTVWIDDEAQMDAVTAVSGSGPAYVFLLAEAMVDAGLARACRPTPRGRWCCKPCWAPRGCSPNPAKTRPTLRRRVTSPGGTTQAAIETFEAGGLRALVACGHAATPPNAAAELSAAND